MLLSALFCLACGLSLLLPVALPCSVPSVHPDRAFSASKCITRGSGAGDMGRRSVFGDRGRCGLAGRGASAPRHGSGRSPRRGSGLGPAAGDGFEFFRGIQPGFAFRRFSVGPLGRSPCRAFRRFPAVPHGTSMLPLWRFPALRSGSWCGSSSCFRPRSAGDFRRRGGRA